MEKKAFPGGNQHEQPSDKNVGPMCVGRNQGWNELGGSADAEKEQGTNYPSSLFLHAPLCWLWSAFRRTFHFGLLLAPGRWVGWVFRDFKHRDGKRRRWGQLAQVTQLAANQTHSLDLYTCISQTRELQLLSRITRLRTKEVKEVFQCYTKAEFRILAGSSFNQPYFCLKGFCIILTGEETQRQKPHIAE